jgi:hypothetical protein
MSAICLGRKGEDAATLGGSCDHRHLRREPSGICDDGMTVALGDGRFVRRRSHMEAVYTNRLAALTE